MFLIALPDSLVLLLLLSYLVCLFLLARKAYFLWKKQAINNLEFLLYVLVIWLVPLVGPLAVYVILKGKSK